MKRENAKKEAEQTENNVRKRGKTVKHQYSEEGKVQFRKQRKIITEKRGRKKVRKAKIKLRERVKKSKRNENRSTISVLSKTSIKMSHIKQMQKERFPEKQGVEERA